MIKFIFGLYIMWLGIINLYHIKENESHVQNCLVSLDEKFSFEGIINFIGFGENEYFSKIKKFHVNFETLKNSSFEIVYVENIALILGGFLCILGYSLSFNFILLGLLIDLIFIHNLYYFTNEKMKVNVLKFLALLGGAFQLA